MNKTAQYVVVGLVSFVLGGLLLLTVYRVAQQRPVAPTAPESKPQALEGSPVPECVVSFTITLPSPTPTPTPTASPTPTPSPTPVATPSPSPTIPPTPTPTATPVPSPSPTPTPIPTPSPTASPTPTPTPIAQCVNIKIYQIVSGQWVLVQNLSSLQPGDTIYIAVLGSTTSGTFERARFRINGLPVNWQETTALNPNGEFYIQYVLPQGTVSYTIEAEVFHSSLGWR